MNDIKKKSQEYAENQTYNFNSPFSQIEKVAEAYKDGYVEGQKETEEKLKCCGNCKYADHIWNKCRYDGNCKNYDKWELAE